LLPEIPENSVDAIVVDPPYFQGMNHNGVRSERAELSISKPFFTSFFASMARTCKPERAVYVFCDWRSNSMFLETMDEYMEVKNSLVWIKNLGTGSYYRNSYETILFHCNSGRRFPIPNVLTGIKSFNGGAKATNGKKQHPTQKPVELIERLINDSTQEGMTILDPMMGRGSSGVACVKTGRKFIGMEIQRKYFDIACRRIEEAYSQ
jgi:site-specific DNA-methyltransferase (adenine-specific)